MADIKNVTIDGVNYNFKDEKARNDTTALKEDISETITITAEPISTRNCNITSDGRINDVTGTYTWICYACQVKAGIRYLVHQNDESNSLICAFYSGDTLPAINDYSYNNQRIVDATSNYIVAPINGWIVFRSADTQTDEGVSYLIANDQTARSGVSSNTSRIQTIEGALPNFDEVVVDGYNLLHAYEEGDGFYDKNGSNKATLYSYSGYKYAIIPISKNTNYYISGSARTLLLTDDNDNVLTYFGSQLDPRRLVNSGNATRMYFTADSSNFNNVDTIVAEGLNGARGLVKKPSFVSGLTQRMASNKYGNALPKVPIYFTVGLPETWYYKNMMALSNNVPDVFFTYDSAFSSKGITINPQNRGLISDGYGYAIYDGNLALVDNKRRAQAYYKADNLQNASVLVIGDSTVNQNYMTQDMLDGFTSRSKTLTLLGTVGTSPNVHEGRSGWSAYDYCSSASKGGITNPFYNDGFDFSYYMTNQGYTAPDFVVIQLGINDLYSAAANLATEQAVQTTIEQTTAYIVEIIDSILDYNSSQKILLNLPTAVNEDCSQHTRFMPLVRNTFVRYNELMQMIATTYSASNVRCTNCHLILDPEEDILNDVHPTTDGYEKMANEVISQINCWQN